MKTYLIAVLVVQSGQSPEDAKAVLEMNVAEGLLSVRHIRGLYVELSLIGGCYSCCRGGPRGLPWQGARPSPTAGDRLLSRRRGAACGGLRGYAGGSRDK